MLGMSLLLVKVVVGIVAVVVVVPEMVLVFFRASPGSWPGPWVVLGGFRNLTTSIVDACYDRGIEVYRFLAIFFFSE